MNVPRQIVIDASVLIKYVVPESDSPATIHMIDQLLLDDKATISIPDLLYIECANVLWKKVRRGEVDAQTAEDSLHDLTELECEVIPLSALSARALRLACDYGISAYDASYLALAEQVGTPLLTADERLVNCLAGSRHQVFALAAVITSSN